MANEIKIPIPSQPATAYFVVIDAVGRYWNTSGTPAFELYNAAHWANYAVALTADGSSQQYSGSFPSAIAAGVYSIICFVQVGGAAATSDTLCGAQDGFQWSGSVQSTLATLATHTDATTIQTAVAALPTAAAIQSGLATHTDATTIEAAIAALPNVASIQSGLATAAGLTSAVGSILAGIPSAVWSTLLSGSTQAGTMLSELASWIVGNSPAQSGAPVQVGGYATGQDPASLILDVSAAAHNITGTIGNKINSGGGSSSNGLGLNPVIFNVNDGSGDNLQLVEVAAFNGTVQVAWSATDTNGNCTLNLNNGTYTITAGLQGVYVGASQSVTINGVPGSPVQFTLQPVSFPSVSSGESMGWAYVTLGDGTTAAPDVTIEWHAVKVGSTDTGAIVLPNPPLSAVSGSDGRVFFPGCRPGGKYGYRPVGSTDWQYFTAVSGLFEVQTVICP